MSTEPYGYVVKPFEDQDLLLRFRTALLRYRAKKSTRAKAMVLGHLAEPKPRCFLLHQTGPPQSDAPQLIQR
jgi:hypothetical protein